MTTAIVPVSPETVLTLATRICRATVLPKHLTHVDKQRLDPEEIEANVLTVMLAGRELGLDPVTALRTVYLVEGRVVISAEAQLALMARHGVIHRWIRADEQAVELELRRPGFPPHRQTWTMEDARRAGLTSRANWRTHPRAMLMARAVTSAARAYCPDVTLGLATPDELADATTWDEAPPEVIDAVQEGDRAREDDAREAFLEALGGLGWTIEDLAAFLAWRAAQEGRVTPPHPAQMSAGQRERLLGWLETEEARASAAAWQGGEE